MFCSNCGNQLEDIAKFCDKCGAPTGAVAEKNSEVKEKQPDNEVKLLVKPTFKWLYFMFPTLLLILGLEIANIILASSTHKWIFMLYAQIPCLIIFFISLIVVWFKKKQLENMEYAFYNTKVIYKDSFLNKAEKEVKYKNIRECVLSRRVVNRIFKQGVVVMYTNAESGFVNGICIPFLNDSEEIYRNIKELIDD